MKKQKIQEILDAQNAAINADMVSLFYLKDSYSDILFTFLYTVYQIWWPLSKDSYSDILL